MKVTKMSNDGSINVSEQRDDADPAVRFLRDRVRGINETEEESVERLVAIIRKSGGKPERVKDDLAEFLRSGDLDG